MKIDKKLNLVIPVECVDGSKAFVHSTPVSSDLFREYWEPVGKTFANIWGDGYNVVAGPRVAALMLEKVSKELKIWDQVKKGLVAEIYRLTNVLIPSEKGWETVPLEEVKRKQRLDALDLEEVESAVIFFTVAWLTNRRKDLGGILDGMSAIWGVRVTSSDCTEFTSSLPTSTETESTGETAAD